MIAAETETKARAHLVKLNALVGSVYFSRTDAA
jgi:hypothetical protein